MKTTHQHRGRTVVTPVYKDLRARPQDGQYCFVVKENGIATYHRFRKRKDAEEQRSEEWKKHQQRAKEKR